MFNTTAYSFRYIRLFLRITFLIVSVYLIIQYYKDIKKLPTNYFDIMSTMLKIYFYASV